MDGSRMLYARITMSQDACWSWLQSPISDEKDARSVDSFLDDLSERGPCDMGYDHDDRSYTIASIGVESGTEAISALRGAASFIDIDIPSYIFLFQADGSSDPYVLVEMRRGKSRFIPPDSSDPDVLYFLNEAEEMIEDLIGSFEQ